MLDSAFLYLYLFSEINIAVIDAILQHTDPSACDLPSVNFNQLFIVLSFMLITRCFRVFKMLAIAILEDHWRLRLIAQQKAGEEG
jgi:hypothetical protein